MLTREQVKQKLQREREGRASLSSSALKTTTGNDIRRRLAEERINKALPKAYETINAAYSGWHTQDEMQQYKSQLADISSQLTDYSDRFGSSFTDANKATVNAYLDTIGKLDDLTELYGYYQNAGAYNNARQKREFDDKYAGNSYEDIQAALAMATGDERKYLQNYTNYSSIEDFEKALEAQGTKKGIFSPETDLEKAFNMYKRKNAYEQYADLVNNYDFAKASKYDPAYTATDLDALSNGMNEAVYRYANNDESFASEVLSSIGGFDNDKRTIVRNMTDEQRSMFNYIYKTQGGNAAWDYIENMQGAIMEPVYNETVDRIQETIDNNSWLKNVGLSVVGDLAQFGAATNLGSEAARSVLDNNYSPYVGASGIINMAADVNAQITQKYKDANPDMEILGINIPAVLTGAATSGIQSRIGQRIFGRPYNAIMGLNSYINAYKDAYESGASAEKIIENAAVAGLTEFLTEQIGFDAAFGTSRNALVQALKSFGAEASEELVGSLVNYANDLVTNGVVSEVKENIQAYVEQGYSEEDANRMAWRDYFGGVAEGAIAAGLSGGVEGGAYQAVSSANARATGAAVDVTKLDAATQGLETNNQLQGVREKYNNDFTSRNARKDLGYVVEDALREDASKSEKADYESKATDIIMSGKTTAQLKAENRAKRFKTAATTNVDGEAAKLQSVKKDGDKITVVTDKGEYDSKSIELSRNDAYIVARAADIQDAEKAAAFVSNYDGSDVTRYDNAFELAYRYGQKEMGISALKEDVANGTININVQTAADIYQAGVAARNTQDKAVAAAQKELKAKWSGTFRQGTFNTDSIDVASLNASERMLLNYAEIFSMVGINVNVIKDSSDSSINGKYDAAKNEVTFNLAARYAKDGDIFDRRFAVSTMSHELTHWMEDKATEEYKNLQNAIFSYYSAIGVNVDDLIAAQQQAYEKNHEGKLSRKAATSEVIARACEDMLNNPDTINQVLSNASIEEARGIKAAISKFFEQIKRFLEDMMAGYGSMSREAQLLRRSAESFEDIRKQWIKALNAAIEFNQALNETTKPTEDTLNSDKADMEYTVEGVSNKLMAYHNLDEASLLKTIKLGGFAMPSIAIKMAELGHNEYGPISVIFGKSTINPANNAANNIYSGDAWTPTFPAVDVKINSNKLAAIRDKVTDLVGGWEIYNRVLHGANLDNDNASDMFNRNRSAANNYANNKTLQYAYLMDAGNGFEIPMKEKKLHPDLSNEAIGAMAKVIGADALEEARQNGYEWQKNNKDIVDKIRVLANEASLRAYDANVANGTKKENAKLREFFATQFDTDGELSFSDFDKLTNAMRRSLGPVETEVDTVAFSNMLNEKVDKEAYSNWLDNLFEGIIEKEGIRNNLDMFMSNGNRRSWDALHWELTLENVVKAMHQQDKQGAAGFFGGQNIWGVATRRYTSIADMRKDIARLVHQNEEERDELRSGFTDRLIAISKDIMNKKADNQFTEYDRAAEAIVESLRGAKTTEAINRELKQWRGLNIKEDTAQQILDLYNEILQMPTDYFEAKPARAVGLDEIAYVVIPSTSSQELKDALNENSIEYHEYEHNDKDITDNADRVRVTNEAAVASDKEVLFSDKQTYANLQTQGRDFSGSLTQQEYARIDQVLKGQYIGEKLLSGEHAFILDNLLVYSYRKKLSRIVTVTHSADSATDLTHATFIMEDLINYEKNRKYEGRSFSDIASAEQRYYGEVVPGRIHIRADYGSSRFSDAKVGFGPEERVRPRANYHFGDEQDGSGSIAESEKYSNKVDSEGNALTDAQAEYFKDSKVRDAKGNLQLMYHGTPAEFTVFDRKKARSSGTYGNGFYFSTSEGHAGTYGKTLKGYLNIVNPIMPGRKTITNAQLKKFVNAIAENEDYGLDNYGYGKTAADVVDMLKGKDDFSIMLDLNTTAIGNAAEAIELFNEVNGTDFDGIISSTESVALRSNQFKNADNDNPTGDEDIRYSDKAQPLTVDYMVNLLGNSENYEDIDMFRNTIRSNKFIHKFVERFAFAYNSNKPGLRNMFDKAAAMLVDFTIASELETNKEFRETYYKLTNHSFIKYSRLYRTIPREYNSLISLMEKYRDNSGNVDAQGRALSKEQSDYFKRSKARNEYGLLKPYYHGTTEFGFRVFNPQKSDDGISFFFTDIISMAESYGAEYVKRAADYVYIDTLEKLNKYFEDTGYYAEEHNGMVFVYDDEEYDEEEFSKREPLASGNNAREAYENWAEMYAWGGLRGENSGIYEVYLNATNPYVADARGKNWNALDAVEGDAINRETDTHYTSVSVSKTADGKLNVRLREDDDSEATEKVMTEKSFASKFGQELLDKVMSDFSTINRPFYMDLWLAPDKHIRDAQVITTRELARYAYNNGYDSLIINNVTDYGQYASSEIPGQVVVVFNSNQIKEVGNTKPTSNEDILLSSKADSEGNILSDNQIAYFGRSKVRDESGALKVMYHGTREAGFETFDTEKSDDKISLFFTDSKEVASTYSGVEEIPEDISDYSFYELAELYERNVTDGIVLQRDDKYVVNKLSGAKFEIQGKFETLEELKDFIVSKIGREVSGANYKVYLNIVNPLEIDADGNAWDGIDGEAAGIDLVDYDNDELFDRIEFVKWNGNKVLVEWALTGGRGGDSEWIDFSDIAARFGSDVYNEIAERYKGSHRTFRRIAVKPDGRYVDLDSYYSTRDIARYAYESGYDGVIIKNLYDSGSYGDADASTVCIAFNANQVKSIDNVNPTDNSNMYYSEKVDSELYDILGEKNRLLKENAKLRKDVRRLDEKLKLQRKVTNGMVLKESDLDTVARTILKDAKSTYEKAELIEGLKEVYNYILENSSGENQIDWEIMMGKAYDVAARVMSKAKPEKIVDDYYKMILNDIRKSRISLDAAQIQEAKNVYGEKYRDAFMGRVVLAKNGTPLDTMWQNWAENYPGVFDSDTNSADMLVELSDIYDEVKDASTTLQYFNDTQSIRAMAEEIYEKFWNVSTVNTIADKYAAQIKKLNFEHRQDMAELKKNANEKRKTDRAYYHNVLQKVREQRDKKIADLKEYQKKKEADRKEAVRKRAAITKITDTCLLLSKWLTENSKKNHIPETLKATVAEFVGAIDYSSKQMLNTLTPTRKDVSIARAMQRVRDAVSRASGAQTSEDYVSDLATYIDFPPQYVEELTKISEDINDIQRRTGEDNAFILQEMTADQLEELLQATMILKHSVTQMNKIISRANAHSVDYYGQKSIRDAADSGKASTNVIKRGVADFLDYNNGLPYYVFKKFGGGASEMFSLLQDGWDRFAFNIQNVIDYANDAYTSEEVNEWEKEVHDFTVLEVPTDAEKAEGAENRERDIQMTTAQIMSLYCLAKREQARGHMLGGGIRIAEFGTGLNKVNQADAVTLTESELVRILGTLTARQKEVADALQEYMNTVCSDWGNEVTMKRFGINAFTEKNYFPIKSDSNVLRADVRDDAQSIYRLLNMSFTKPLVQKANNQIVIDSIFSVFSTHASDMAKYNSLALPVLDMIKWWNYKEAENRGEDAFTTQTVKASFESAYGKDANKYIRTFLMDLNGATSGGSYDFKGKKLAKGYKAAAVGANVQTALLQPISYIRAGYVMNAKYLAKAMLRPSSMEKVESLSGIGIWKGLNLFDTNVSRGIDHKIKHDDTWASSIIEKSMKLAEFGDKWTWGKLWNACEIEVSEKQHLPIGSEEYNKAVADRFREVIYSTQVVDSTMTRSDIMRSKDYFAQTITAFMSEPTVSINILLNAGETFNTEYRKNGLQSAMQKQGKTIAKAAEVYIIAAVVESAMRAAIGKLRDKEEDSEYIELLWANLQDELLLFNKIPYIKDIISIFQGYSASRMDTAAITSIYYAIKALDKSHDEGWTYRTTYKILDAVSKVTGLPMANAMRELATVWNNTIGLMYPDLQLNK